MNRKVDQECKSDNIEEKSDASLEQRRVFLKRFGDQPGLIIDRNRKIHEFFTKRKSSCNDISSQKGVIVDNHDRNKIELEPSQKVKLNQKLYKGKAEAQNFDQKSEQNTCNQPLKRAVKGKHQAKCKSAKCKSATEGQPKDLWESAVHPS